MRTLPFNKIITILGLYPKDLAVHFPRAVQIPLPTILNGLTIGIGNKKQEYNTYTFRIKKLQK